MTKPVVVVLGGYGTFGSLICASLARHEDVRVLVAGRDGRTAETFCRTLERSPETARSASLEPVEIDCAARDFRTRLAALTPAVVIDTAGPFQARDYAVAFACLDVRAHYIDLGDGRDYVAGINTLDSLASSRGVLVVSGASTCPALTTAVVDDLSRDFEELTEVSFALAPGLRAPRGLATTRGVLGYCGRIIPAWRYGNREVVRGWGGLTRHKYPDPVGRRWLSFVDLPETDLWPKRYPTLWQIETRAGMEPSFVHLGLTCLSMLVRMYLLVSLEPYAMKLLRLSNALSRFGGDAGAMHVTVTGRKSGSDFAERTWTIVAEKAHGPHIPATPAALLAKKLLGLRGYAPLDLRGAMPCMGLLTLEEILAELRGLAICTDTQLG